jgi:hypothetical protein
LNLRKLIAQSGGNPPSLFKQSLVEKPSSLAEHRFQCGKQRGLKSIWIIQPIHREPSILLLDPKCTGQALYKWGVWVFGNSWEKRDAMENQFER